MIRRKVLIIDDELEDHASPGMVDSPRDDTYLEVIAQLNAIAPQHFTYEALLCGSEEQALRELRSVTHSKGELLSIVDLVLDEGSRFSEIGTSELLEEILDKSRLTFFTTRRLEAAKISSLVKFQKAKRSAGLFPLELLEAQPKEFARLLHRGLEEYDDGKAIGYIEHLQSQGFSEINILLISDFHFDETGLGHSSVDLDNAFDKLNDIIGERRLDLIFMLGDFTDRGIESGFETAHEFIKVLCRSANFQDLPSDFLHIVPGNHDVVVPLSLSSFVERFDDGYKLADKRRNEGLSRYGIQPFHHFRDRVTNGVQYFGDDGNDAIVAKRHWIDTRWETLGFIVVGFDSNSYPTSTEPVTGSIESSSLISFRRIASQIPKAQRRCLVLLVLAHHYTGDGGKERGVAEREELRRYCSELSFKGVVFMNGDRHGDPMPKLGQQLSNEGTTPLEIAVPTFCQSNPKRQEGASRGFLLLTLGSDKGEVERATARAFTFREGSALDASTPREYLLDRNGWRRPS